MLLFCFRRRKPHPLVRRIIVFRCQNDDTTMNNRRPLHVRARQEWQCAGEHSIHDYNIWFERRYELTEHWN